MAKRWGWGRMAWDVAPVIVLAGVGVALLRDPSRPLVERQGTQRPPLFGRGRGAHSPAQIPIRGWKDILVRTFKEFRQDQAPMIAAGMAFYALLALFPALGAMVALYGLFADIGEVQKHLHLLSFLLPPAALKLIGDQMIRLAAAKGQGLSFAFALGLVAAIWSANGAVKALMTGLNIAFEIKETRSFVRVNLISLALTIGLVVFGVAGLGLMAAGPVIETFVGEHARRVLDWVSWPVLLVILTVVLALVYRYGPNREAPWRWITWGSAAAIVLWVIVSAGFSLYVGNFGHYDRTYGSLGAVVGFMTWAWLSSMVVLTGAELNSEVERQASLTGQPAAD